MNKDNGQGILNYYNEFSSNVETSLQRIEDIISNNITLADDEDEGEILFFLQEYKSKKCIRILYTPPQTDESSVPKYEHKLGKLDLNKFENKIKSKILILKKEIKQNT